MSASFFGVLRNHNHTSAVGDGGQLSDLTVSGDVTATDDLIAQDDITATGQISGADATLGTEMPSLNQVMVFQLLMNNARPI